MTENRQYEEMLLAARRKLKDRLPKDIAEKGNILYDPIKQEFRFGVFGTDVIVQYPEYLVMPELDMWLVLSILQYMDEADGTALTHKQMALSEFKEGGLIRGSSFDRENERIVQTGIGKMEYEAVKKAVLRMGGELMQGKADLCARFLFMPNYPLHLNLWFEDDEFPASCKILFDQNAEHYLKVEAAGTVAALLLTELEKRLK